jgi:hypothetical protein
LNVPGAEAGSAVDVEAFATSRLIQDSPDLKPFAQFPAPTMKNCVMALELRGFTLIVSALGKVIERLLAGHF